MTEKKREESKKKKAVEKSKFYRIFENYDCESDSDDFNESVQRELQNTKQNAAVGVENLKRALQCKKPSRGLKTFRVKLNVNSNQDPYKKKKKISGYSYVQEFSILKKDYSRFRDLCISKFLNDNVKEHNELIEKVQKYFKQVHCKGMAFELMKKTIEEYEMKYERNEVGEEDEQNEK